MPETDGTFPATHPTSTSGALPPATPSERRPSATGRTRTLIEVRQEYPCDSCDAPCCYYLPLHSFTITNLQELDHALYLLNFPRIELGLSATGEWGVYYRHPCRFFDREARRCTIYNDERRPSICAHYNPFACWYKRSVVSGTDESFLRVDRRRMDVLLEHVTFDEANNLANTPDWPQLLTLFESLPLPAEFDAESEEDTVFERWLYEAAYGVPSPQPAAKHSYISLSDPCNGCGAFCCKYLVFPQATPLNRVSLDFLQFALGFPGIELGVSDTDWHLIVQTRCRHLIDNRCSLFGRPERPLICTYYDAHGCEYVAQFGMPRPAGFMRVKLEQFDWLVEPIEFDQYGTIIGLPATEELRQHVEQRWHETVVAAASGTSESAR